MKWKGRVWRFGNHVDTDLIIPARYLNVSDEHELAKYCFVDVRPDFVKEVRAGDIVVAGVNFGCGSSREHAPRAMKAAGVGAVIAKSFARIFYRNAFNIGLAVLESDEAAEALKEGDEISIDLEKGEIADLRSGRSCRSNPIPDFMMRLVETGGLLACVEREGKS